jgi:hypothetical protein
VELSDFGQDTFVFGDVLTSLFTQCNFNRERREVGKEFM